jgi:hypothetical protein
VEKWRVVFWFERDSEVRYVTKPPEVGEYVSHGDELWLVSGLVEDGLGISVTCERARDSSSGAVSAKHVGRAGESEYHG